MADYKKLERPKASWFWMKNTSGKADAALTLMVLSFLLSCVLAIAGAFQEIRVGDTSVTFTEYNMGFATTVLVPLIGLYFGRRWTDTHRGLYDQQKLYAPNKDEVPKEETPEEER